MIESVEEVTTHYVTLKKAEFPELRRNGSRNWEVLMGMSWEPIYWDDQIDKLEEAYVSYFSTKS